MQGMLCTCACSTSLFYLFCYSPISPHTTVTILFSILNLFLRLSFPLFFSHSLSNLLLLIYLFSSVSLPCFSSLSSLLPSSRTISSTRTRSLILSNSNTSKDRVRVRLSQRQRMVGPSGPTGTIKTAAFTLYDTTRHDGRLCCCCTSRMTLNAYHFICGIQLPSACSRNCRPSIANHQLCIWKLRAAKSVVRLMPHEHSGI